MKTNQLNHPLLSILISILSLYITVNFNTHAEIKNNSSFVGSTNARLMNLEKETEKISSRIDIVWNNLKIKN